MRFPGLRYRDEWLPNFYPSKEFPPWGHIRCSRTGRIILLSDEENATLDEVSMDEALFQRLEQSGHIITRENSASVFDKYQEWQDKTYGGPQLHIIALTKRCNLSCTYCHMNPEPVKASKSQFDMQPETMDEVIRFALDTPADSINFEFQGGEPFLHFDGIRYFVDAVRRQNEARGKTIDYSVVTNLMLLKAEHLDFCREHGINVSYTVNGPKELHDHYRKTRRGAGSFDAVMKRFNQFRDDYSDVLSTSPLCVVGSHNVGDLIRTIDFCQEQGFGGVAIIKLKNLGHTVRNGITLDIHEFLRHYIEAVEYIYEKNKTLAKPGSERLIRVVLAKIMGRSDLGYVDWRNPCGDFGGAITYDYDGEILPSDEARSLRSEFGLGNVRDTTYEELVRSRRGLRSMNLSLRDREPVCRECPVNPYCGVLPVMEFARNGDARPRPHESEECLITLTIVEWVLAKMLEDPIPLLRMLPGGDAVLGEMVSNLREQAVN